MNYLVEKLIKSEVIKNYSSLVYRQDFSDAKYKFEFPITEGMTMEQLKEDLIEDIFKLTLSIRNHTGGVTHISDEDKEPTEVDANTLEETYGGKEYILYILFPSRMAQPKPKKMLLGFYILIPGRPICRNINRYFAKIENIISTKGAKSRIADPSVKKILEEVRFYGIDSIKSLDFYVFEKTNYDNEKRYHIIMVYNFKDGGEQILKDRKKTKELEAEVKRIEREKAEARQRKREEEQEQYEKEREEYFKRKNEFLSQYSGPESYYAEKEWLRTNGDPRFEDFGSMRRSNYTGD